MRRLVALAAALTLLLPGAAARARSALLPRAPGASGVRADAVEQMRRAARDAASRSDAKGADAAGDSGGLEQVLVVPERPGKNNVRYYDFNWRRYDYLDHEGQGGVRLYYYDREEEIARVAGALVREQYERLARRFNYRPATRVPYILYNSHREFENTNVFFVNEFVLGVTSPLDLRMALPFWGEIERFREVSTHEMVHQFTIQKVADRAARTGAESPIQAMPLWFIEGLAEYYSKDGVDLETDMFARDILLEPRPDRGYALPGFWDDSPQGFIYTYKMGQLRVAFMADTWGERIVQAVLDQSPRLLGASRAGMAPAGDREDFKALVSRLTGEKPEDMQMKWTAWMKRRYLPAYLAARQEPPAIDPVELPGEPDAFTASRDGYTLLYRSVERESGRARLYLADRRARDSAVQVAVDGQPNIESLHPVLRGVTALAADRIAFLARHGAADALYVVPFERRGEGDRTRFKLGSRRRIELARADLIEAGDPVFSPSGDRVAFYALDGTGRIDLWTAELDSGKLTRITNDLYAERELSWVDESPAVYGVDTAEGAHDGTLVFTSDQTADRRYNLFALDPRTGARARLTDEPADHRAPYALGGGLVVFASDARGKQDLHLYSAQTGRLKRLTDFVTALTAPAPGPRGLQALGFLGGRYHLFDVPSQRFLTLDERAARDGEPEPPAPFPQEPIPTDAPRYEPFKLANWRLENGIAAVGATGTFGQTGQGALLFGDVLSDRNVVTQFAVFGSLELTDALVFFVDRSRRSVFGAGLFHTFTQRRDTEAPGFAARDVLYLQREFGLAGLYSYPLDTFARLELRSAVQGVSRAFQGPLTPDGFLDLRVPLPSLRQWRDSRGGVDLEGLLALRLGYDTTRFQFPGGAAGGGSVLFEVGGGWLPLRSELHRYATLDTQYHLGILGFSTLHFRLAGGWSAGSVFGRQFFLSSYDNLRMFDVSDERLLGFSYAVTNVDYELPLNAIIRLALVSNISGIAGLDFGSVAEETGHLWDSRTLAYVLGANVGLGPFEVRVHWARPVDVGGLPLCGSGKRAPHGCVEDGWVPNVSLRYVYF